MRLAVFAVLVVAGCTFSPNTNSGQPGDAGNDGAKLDGKAFLDAPAKLDGSAGAQGFAVVQQANNANNSSGSITASFPSPPAAGHLVMLVGGDSVGSGTQVDGVGSSWTLVTGSYKDVDVEVWYTVADGTHTDVTLSFAQANDAPIFMTITELAGIDTATSPVDVSASGHGGADTTARPGPVMTTAPDVVVLALASASTMDFTTPVGETALDTVTVAGGADFDPGVIGAWYEPGNTPGSYDIGILSPGAWDGAVVAFKLQ